MFEFWVSAVSAGRQVDEDEDVELDEDGEAKEDRVHEEAGESKTSVQNPLVQMDPQNLENCGEAKKEREKERTSSFLAVVFFLVCSKQKILLRSSIFFHSP